MNNIELQWHAEKRLVKDLDLWLSNPRKITKEAFAKLKERIVQRGFHDVIKIDVDNTILSGNQRKKALIDLNITEVTALVPNRKLTDEERSKIALESNTSDGQWAYDKLKSFDTTLLTDIGFSAVDLSNIWSENLDVENDSFDEDTEIAEIKVPETKLGDLILMGSHKLICGDSTDPSVLKKLFGEEKCSMIYSDPVYNLNYNYKSGLGGKSNYGGTVNDSRTDDEYKEFLKKSMVAALAVAKDDLCIGYWCDQRYIWLIQILYRELGITNKRVLIWLKNGFNCVPSDHFNKGYEPCVFGVRGKPYVADNLRNLNEIMNKEVTSGNAGLEEALDILAVKRLAGNDYSHATSKPPQLHYKVIKRCSYINDIILDSFSGSASTMIAAEQLGRRVYAVELEPLYCDLAIRRWERISGQKATVIRDEKA